MTGDRTIIKMCIKCRRLVQIGTLVCPDCGGILFETVGLDNEELDG